MGMWFGISSNFGLRFNGKDIIRKLVKYMTRIMLSTSFNWLGRNCAEMVKGQ